MDGEYKIILGSLSVLIAFVGYIIYFKQIFLGKIKPHAFSWFIWGLLTGIMFVAQITEGGGSGAWVTGVTAFACFVIFAISLLKGEREFVKLDWLFLVSALLSLFLWWITKQPVLSVILITITDAFGASLTLRKGYYKPFEESATLFALNSIKVVVALFALESYALATWLYPTYLVIGNGLIVLMLLIRRRQIG